MAKKWDFCGWATKNNLKCSDGLTIRDGAFKVQDGQKVPLIYNHDHGDPDLILGHAILRNKKEGVYAYCKLNNNAKAKSVKEALVHGDIASLSIWANQLVKDGSDVLHGVIREVSVVLAGANPGAYVESVLAHGEPIGEYDEEGIIHTGEPLELFHSQTKRISQPTYEEYDEEEDDDMASRTIGEIYDNMTDEQKDAVAVMVGMALEDDEEDYEDYDEEDYEDYDEEEDDDMGHNVFEGGDYYDGSATRTIQHSEMEQILKDGKSAGSLREAVDYHLESGILSHGDIDLTGMTVATGNQTYGFNDPSMLFPEFKTVTGETPVWISRNMDWANKLMSLVGRTPFSRIKSLFANITEDEARARGYIKGKKKKEEVFTTLKRVTEAKTIYKLQKMDRDDIIDITGFDVLAWIRAEMRMMLNEEIARAVLIGDGRQSDSEDKIDENNIRPIAKDVDLFNIKRIVTVGASADEDEIAKAVIRIALKARKDYKGSGNPMFWTTEEMLTNMLLLEDGIGHRLYKTEQELATALRVKEIVTVEVMENQTIDGKELLGVIVNPVDYKIGANKGGEINMFDDFDINYNQQSYLIETRISGALVKPFSAITLLLDKKGGSGSSGDDET